MPLPEPRNTEERDDFIERCMENETMIDEFSDEDQRYAVCESLWNDDDKGQIFMFDFYIKNFTLNA